MNLKIVADLRLARHLARLLAPPRNGMERLSLLALPALLALRGVMEAFSLGALVLFVVQSGLGPQADTLLAPVRGVLARHDLPFELAFAGVIALFIVKNLLYAQVLAIRARQNQRWICQIGDHLYRQYLDSSFHGENHQVLSSNGGTVSNAVIHAVHDFLSPLIDAIAEIMVVIALAAILLCLSGINTVFVVLVPGGLTWWGYRLLGSRARAQALNRLHSNGRMQRWVEDTGRAGREIALYGAADAFAARTARLFATLAGAVTGHRNSHELIFPMCEVAAILGLALLVALLALGPGVTSVSLLTYLAVGGRLLPSFRRLATALHTVAAHRTDVQSLLASIRPPRPAAPVQWRDQDAIVALHGIGYRHPDGADFLFRAIDLAIHPGQWVAVMGESGSGKSSLIDLIIGRLSPAEGQVVWQADGRSGVGYAGPTATILELDRDDNIGFPHARAFSADAIAEALDIAQAAHLTLSPADSPSGDRMLSTGERQRLGLARAVLHARTLLILDEATASLDENTEARFLDALRARRPHLAVLMITHRPSTAGRADCSLCLRAGRLEPVIAPA